MLSQNIFLMVEILNLGKLLAVKCLKR